MPPVREKDENNRPLHEDYKIVKKILDHLGIYEFERKRLPPKVAEDPAEFDDYIIDDYTESDHVC